jgi:HEAT repeat protein
MNHSAASEQILSVVGTGSPVLRNRLRQLLAGTAWPSDDTAKMGGTSRIVGAIEKAPTTGHRRADLIFLLGPVALREREAQAALPVLRTALSGSFEEQVRALASAGLIAEGTDATAAEARALLADVGTKSADGVVRTFAVTEWMHLPPQTFDWSAALRDADPRVREIAAGALGRSKRSQAATEIIAGAQQEPWPSVRRAEVAALGELCTNEGNELLVRAYERDQTDVRMAALESLTRCREPRVPSLLLRVLGRLPESADLRSLAARLLVDLKDPRTIKPMAEALVRLQAESQADMALEGTATETVLALARLGGPEAVGAAVKLLNDDRPSLKRAAVEALGLMCDPGPGATALRAATENKDESVSLPAAAAQQRCRQKATP